MHDETKLVHPAIYGVLCDSFWPSEILTFWLTKAWNSSFLHNGWPVLGWRCIGSFNKRSCWLRSSCSPLLLISRYTRIHTHLNCSFRVFCDFSCFLYNQIYLDDNIGWNFFFGLFKWKKNTTSDFVHGVWKQKKSSRNAIFAWYAFPKRSRRQFYQTSCPRLQIPQEIWYHIDRLCASVLKNLCYHFHGIFFYLKKVEKSISHQVVIMKRNVRANTRGTSRPKNVCL